MDLCILQIFSNFFSKSNNLFRLPIIGICNCSILDYHFYIFVKIPLVDIFFHGRFDINNIKFNFVNISFIGVFCTQLSS